MQTKKKTKEDKNKIKFDDGQLYCWQWLTRDRPYLSSERALNKDKTATIQTELISGRKSQGGLDSKIYWLADRQS
jgi:hypothetical protein